MRVTPIPFEKFFEFRIDNSFRNFKNKNFASGHAPTVSAPQVVKTLSVPIVESAAPTAIPTSDSEIPWGRIILITAIAVGVVYVGYRIYTKHQEERREQTN